MPKDTVSHRKVKPAFRKAEPDHRKRIQINDEHDQTWVTCLNCGAQWSVAKTPDGLDFERVSEGDGYCDGNR